MTTLTLPWPPGVNNLFPTRGRIRVPSARYRAWLKDAGLMLLAQRWKPATGPVRIAVTLFPPDRRARDADGYLKAPIDLLVKAGVIADDSARYVRAVSAEWSDLPPAKPGRVTIKLEAA